MSARIYECKLGKGEGKFPIARLTGRVDFMGVRNCFFFRKMQEITSVSYILQKRRKTEKKDRLKGLKHQLNVTRSLR